MIQALFGTVLLLLGNEAPDGLHYLYGVLPLLVSVLAEAIRAGAAERELEGLDFDALPEDRQRTVALAIVRRETGIMAVSALIVVFLALRAAATSWTAVLGRSPAISPLLGWAEIERNSSIPGQTATYRRRGC